MLTTPRLWAVFCGVTACENGGMPLATDTGKASDSGAAVESGESASQNESGTPDSASGGDSGTDSGGDSGRGTDSDTAADSGLDSGADSGGEDTAADSWRSSLYPEDWSAAAPDPDGDGFYLQDYSYAGYHASEGDIPVVAGPYYNVDDYGADPTGTTDSTAAIQAAIDAASAGGVVNFGAGIYRAEGTLSVTHDGTVLRGQGAAMTQLYFTKSADMDFSAHLSFTGALVEGTDHPLLTDGAVLSTTVDVDSADFAVGDEVLVGWTITDDFVAEHSMTGVWTEFNGEWRGFFRRTVTSVGSGTLSFDVPLRYPAKMRDSASVRKVSGYLTECGIEDIAISNAQDWDVAWGTNQVHAVWFTQVQDCWMRGVESFGSPYVTDGTGTHLTSSGVLVNQSRRVTIADSALSNAANRGDGGNGYLFEIRQSNEVLVRDSVATEGRHNFIQNWDFGTSGCVWLRVTSQDGNCRFADWDPVGFSCYSEYHHSLAMANLVDDSDVFDGWQGVNRQTESTGAGHSATQSVFWNIRGPGYLRSLQYGNGYVVGTENLDLHVDPTEWDWNNSGEYTEPQDWLEGEDLAGTLEPLSLFEDQLARRLGP